MKEWRKQFSASHWPITIAGGAGFGLSMGFIYIIAPNLSAEARMLATVSSYAAILVLSWAMAISLKETILLAYFKSGVRWQARLKREDDHVTIELSPFSADHPRPSDGSEYYDVSFKISDS